LEWPATSTDFSRLRNRPVRRPPCHDPVTQDGDTMPAAIECPQCQKKFRVREEQVGKKLRCPACQAIFAAKALDTGIVAASGSTGPAPASPAPASAPQRTDDVVEAEVVVESRPRVHEVMEADIVDESRPRAEETRFAERGAKREEYEDRREPPLRTRRSDD